MELLCGACSQEKGLSIEERMKIAKSRLPDVAYRCPDCAREHTYRGIGGALARSASAEGMEKEKTKNDDKSRDEYDQLSLF